MIPAASTTVIGGYVYLYTLKIDEVQKARSMVLVRAAVKTLELGARRLEYFSKDHKWRPGFNVADALPVISPGATEMTVRYHEDSRKFVAVTGPDYLSNSIKISTSDTLTGPWSEWRSLYSVPEVTTGKPGFDRDTFCYAGKEHIEFYDAEKKELSITYVCNSSNFQTLISNLTLYHPVSIHIPL